jgi:hypothetical protein
LKRWRPSTPSIARQDESLAARPSAIAPSTRPRSRAVVVLLRPASYALPSSTPRSTWIESAPSAWAVALARSGPTRAIRMLVARLLDTVIISSQLAHRGPAADPALTSSLNRRRSGRGGSTSDAKVRVTGSESSSDSSPASRSRNTCTITGTFIVLAA